MSSKSLKIKKQAKINNIEKLQNGFVLEQEIRATKLQSDDNTPFFLVPDNKHDDNHSK